MVEAFDEEGDGGWWELLVVSEQQRQKADGDVLELPRPSGQRGAVESRHGDGEGTTSSSEAV